MLKLLIAEDEKTTRDVLENYIPWTDLNIDFVATAKNGLEALKIAQEINPDILLTDVRMPKMDGITLATNMAQSYPNCKIIFLSGHSDKDYLKAAINIKAFSYIEKPIKIKEIKSVIERAVTLINNEAASQISINEIKSSLSHSMPLIRKEITFELIKMNSNVKLLRDKYGSILNEISRNSSFCALNISITWENSIKETQREIIQGDLLNAIDSYIFAGSNNLLSSIDEFGNIVVILILDAQIEIDYLHSIIEQLFKLLKEICFEKISISFGVGNTVMDIHEISDSYITSVQSLKQQFYDGTDKIFYPSHNSGSSFFQIDKNLYEDFKTYLQRDDMKSSILLVNELTEKVKACFDMDINHIKNIYFNLLLNILQFAIDGKIIDSTSDNSKNYVWHKIETISTLNELSEYVNSNIEIIFKHLEDNAEINRTIKDVMQFIHENYTDNNLSIQSIANHVYLTPNYLCNVFKKNTGNTINDFITKVRMEKARELMKDRQLKLYEIARSIGFTDVKYFSTLFKRYWGYTCTEYKEKYNI